MTIVESYLPPLAGESMLGSSEPLCGDIHDQIARYGGYQAIELAWNYIAMNRGNYQICAFLDGRLAAAVVDDQSSFAIPNLPPGLHGLQLRAFSRYESLPRVILDPYGRRIALAWLPPLDNDPTIASWRVTWDAGLGASPTTLLAEVTEMAIEERSRQLCDTGTGKGRYSAYGSVPVELGTFNGVLTIEITGSGTLEYSFNGGSTTAATFGTQSILTLSHGVKLIMHDDPEDYTTGDTFQVFVGPARFYVTDALAPGTYRFGITSVDAAGNVDDMETMAPIRILAIPEPVDAPTMSYDSIELTVDITIPAGATGVRVYANWNPHTGKFLDYIPWKDAAPLAEFIGSGLQTWVFNPGVEEGTLRFMVWAIDAEDERQDMTIHSFSFPPTPSDIGFTLGSPTNLTATPLADGFWRLEWDYRLEDGDDMASCRVFLHSPSSEAIDYDADLLVILLKQDASGYPSLHFTYESSEAAAGPIRLAVRAFAADEVTHDGNTDYVILTPDSTPPSRPRRLTGGAA